MTLFHIGGSKSDTHRIGSYPGLQRLRVGCSTLASLAPFIPEQEAVTDKPSPASGQNAKGDDTYIIRHEDKGCSIL